ncbi:hypothetical protein BDQ17DRAFT_1248936 [Cyathus striatus]|nr:hypothetical protein BDQ17DRAFT_1248936 [Cyathus striatus]
MFSLPAYELTGLFLETYFYGVNSISFAFCLHSLLTTAGRRRSREEINWIMLTIGCTLFFVASLDMFLTFTRCLQAFIFYDGPGGPAAVFSDLGYWITLTTSFTTLFQTVIGDGVLIYRCWIVYSRSWRVIIISILLWIGAAISMTLIIQIQANLHTSGTVTAAKLQPPNRSFWIISIIQNVLTTTLIVGRIRHVDRENSRFSFHDTNSRRKSDLKKVMRRIIESGLLYTLAVTVTFITYACGSNALYVTSKALKQIVVIAFNLIIIRASKSSPNEYTIASTGPMELQITSTTTGIGASSSITAPVQLIISRDVRHDGYSFASMEATEERKADLHSNSNLSDIKTP